MFASYIIMVVFSCTKSDSCNKGNSQNKAFVKSSLISFVTNKYGRYLFCRNFPTLGEEGGLVVRAQDC